VTYIPPRVFESKFTCPNCSAIAKQSWSKRAQNFNVGVDDAHNRIRIAICDHCQKYSLWHFDTMVYPMVLGLAPFLFGRPSDLNFPDVKLATRKWWLQATCQKMPDGCNNSPEKDSCGELSGFKEINFSYGYDLSYPTVRIYQRFHP
jgi:hypothetical protein